MPNDIENLPRYSCISVIPKYYENILEMFRIGQVSDEIARPFVAAIMRLFRNAYFQTSDTDAIVEFETALDLPSTGTIEQRRQAVIDRINNTFIFNDDALVALIESLAGGEPIHVSVDPITLVLKIWQLVEESDDGVLAAEVLVKIRDMIPANLSAQALNFSKPSLNLSITTGSHCTFKCSLTAHYPKFEPVAWFAPKNWTIFPF